MSDIRSPKLPTRAFEKPQKKEIPPFLRKLFLLIAFFFFLILALYLLSLLTPLNILRLDKLPVGWQAVFLDSGQVYFGQIKKETKDILILKNVYYLPQNIEALKGTQDISEEIGLVKLGDELHKPEDEMRINRDHILFIETLKEDSPVVEAINR